MPNAYAIASLDESFNGFANTCRCRSDPSVCLVRHITFVNNKTFSKQPASVEQVSMLAGKDR
jgi:hypothetical protein